MAKAWVNVDYEGWFYQFKQATGGRGMTRAARRIVLTLPNRQTVEYWHDKIIPLHFEASARSRYHYRARKPIYRGIKVRLSRGEDVWVKGQKLPAERVIKGGRVDAVRSGRLESTVERRRVVFANENRGVMTIGVPTWITRPPAGRPNIGDEVTRLTKRENQTLTAVWRRGFYRGVRAVGSSGIRTRVRIRG